MAILNRAFVREVDRRAIQDYGMTGLVLMENAGRGVAETLQRLLRSLEPSPSGRGQGEGAGNPRSTSAPSTLTPTLSQGARGHVTIVCGKGNNGGDGFVIARHLDNFGISVRVLLLANANQLTGDALANYSILLKAGFQIEEFIEPFDIARFDAALAGSAWLVDCILGTGASGEPKSPFAEAIERMNASNIPILAVDLPSGLDCDTGIAASHTVRATQTCTFVAYKPGLLLPAAKSFVGNVEVIDIGVPRKLLEEIEAEARALNKQK